MGSWMQQTTYGYLCENVETFGITWVNYEKNYVPSLLGGKTYYAREG